MESVGHLGPKLLYRRLDRLFASLDLSLPASETLRRFLDEFQASLAGDLHIIASVLLDERRDGYEICHVVGDPGGAVPEELPLAAASLVRVIADRAAVFPDPNSADAPARHGLFPDSPSAGIAVGQPPKQHICLFRLSESWPREEVDFALNTVRSALGARLVDEHVRGSVLQAAEIQRSLLVDAAPPFAGYEIACVSIPAEEVGGDFYDFIPFDAEMTGLAIGDASGHGLPAALLVRDVVTGLRMGIERELKIGHVFSKLNRVIHRSRLTSRFISVFYGELEANGNLIYVNAGHPAPLLFLRDRTVDLSTGGTVIGPLPEVRFKRGFAHVDRDAVLVMYTDGIVERMDKHGEQFDRERLVAVVSAKRKDTASEILDTLLEEVRKFGDGLPFEDDATLVVVKRLP